MAEWNIPPCRLPEEPYTTEQYACYVNACSDYLDDVSDCIDAGGTEKQVQDCINAKHQAYLKQLPICDTM
jgi:hypothetical protein